MLVQIAIPVITLLEGPGYTMSLSLLASSTSARMGSGKGAREVWAISRGLSPWGAVFGEDTALSLPPDLNVGGSGNSALWGV